MSEAQFHRAAYGARRDKRGVIPGVHPRLPRNLAILTFSAGIRNLSMLKHPAPVHSE